MSSPPELSHGGRTWLGARPIDVTTAFVSDHVVVLTTVRSRRRDTAPLRRVHYVDPDTKKRLVFFTSNFILPAVTIVLLYKARSQVELFFKWIKQHVRIKTFCGTTENAVKTQRWMDCLVALCPGCYRQETSRSRCHSLLFTF